VSDLAQLTSQIDAFDVLRVRGKLRGSRGLLLTATLPAAVGDRCRIVSPRQHNGVYGEVIGFHNDLAYLVLYEQAEVHPGMDVVRLGQATTLFMGPGLLGRVVDGLGRPVDGLGALAGCAPHPLKLQAPPALERAPIREIFATGQRAMDGLLTCGHGQRGIFAGSGVGKSTLLGEIAKYSDAAINVIALIGERGREVRPFIEDCLGAEGLAKSVVVVATSDQSPLLRIRAAHVAMAYADFFRAQGKHVLFLCDSLTRLAMAQRELGLALGEPPSARSYTPSVFQLLASLVERLGNAKQGSITSILTVLVEGGDLDEPIADAVRSLIDGHIVLDRRLAEQGHYPAISIRQSISRLAHDLMDTVQREAARKVSAALAVYAEAEDLIRIGGYVKGASAEVDHAVQMRPRILNFLRQGINEHTDFAATKTALRQLAAAWPF
jgi:flagellum-specific ATP synthase